jgi:hypothetical protein
MSAAKILLTVLCLGSSDWRGGQAANPTSSAPEVFNATAEVKNATGAISGTVEVRITRYTPDFDRTAVESALRHGGYPGFLTTLRKTPEVGQIVLGGGEPYAIRYAREQVEADGRTLVLVTDKPVFFLGGARSDAKPRAGYEVAVIRLQVDKTGRGSGTLAAAARVRPAGGGGVILDDYADKPIALTAITRKPS